MPSKEPAFGRRSGLRVWPCRSLAALLGEGLRLALISVAFKMNVLLEIV